MDNYSHSTMTKDGKAIEKVRHAINYLIISLDYMQDALTNAAIKPRLHTIYNMIAASDSLFNLALHAFKRINAFTDTKIYSINKSCVEAATEDMRIIVDMCKKIKMFEFSYEDIEESN